MDSLPAATKVGFVPGNGTTVAGAIPRRVTPTGVPIVEPDDVVPLFGKARTELVIPVNQVIGQAGDQKERPAGRLPDRLLRDTNAVGSGVGHRSTPF